MSSDTASFHSPTSPVSYGSTGYIPVIPVSKQTNTPHQRHTFVESDMGDQSESSFQALFESALHDYEKQTGIPLANHPLAGQLQNCQSLESVTTLLQEQARAFSEFRESDKITKSLKTVVLALSRVSATATLGHDIGMVCSRLMTSRSTSLTPIQ